MPLIWPKQGTLPVADALASPYLDACAVALYKNDYIPVIGSVLGDFVEATFPGYAPQDINISNPAFLNGQGAAELDADLVTFTQTAGPAQLVYGYFVYDATLVVIAAQRFPAPQNMTGAGASLDVGVKFVFHSEFNG